MTVWNVDIMWGLMLFGITLFTGCFIVVNRAMRGLRLCGLVLAYAALAWMLATLSWKVAVTTWLVFAAMGGLIVFGYELWARRRYAGTGRPPRPLVLLQGFLLWPAMLPEAIEGMAVDVGFLPPSPEGPDA